MKSRNRDAKALKQSRNNKRINKTHRERGKRASRKRFAYSPQKEARKKQMKVEAEQRTQSLTDAFVHRARTVCTQEEVRALCQEVWALRHVNSAYLGQVDRILKNRRAAGELPIY